MQINGEMIPREELIRLVKKYSPQVEKLNSRGIFPTEFELITAMAFDWFQSENCDFVVLEVGLGGLYDSTNVVNKPAVSVIAHIDFDHEEVLGRTIEEITLQKCGVIKDDCPCVLYPEQYGEVFGVVENECKKHNSRLVIPDINEPRDISIENFCTSFIYMKSEYNLRMTGRHQVLNAITAIEALKLVGCDEGSIIQGVSQAALPARIEVISRDPLIILDGAHNPDGAKALAQSLEGVGKYVAVVSVMRDKDVEGCLKHLLWNAKTVVATKCENPRAMDAHELAELCKNHCGNVLPIENPEKAVETALELSGGIPVVICGSLYLAAQVRDFVRKKSREYK